MNTPFTTNRFDDDEASENYHSAITGNDLFRRVIALEFGIGLLGIILIAVFNLPSLWETLAGLIDPAGLALGMLAGTASAGAILALLKLIPSLLRATAIQALALFRNVSIPQAVFLGLAAGIGEELLFRGALQPSFGILFTSALFALLHPFGWLYVTIAFAISLGLGWLAVLTGGLAAPAAAHACYDALLFLAIRFGALRIPTPAPHNEQ